MDDIRVLVVANDPLARAGLAALLTGRCIVVGQVAGDADLAASVDVYRPAVLVWDLGWDPDPAAGMEMDDGLPPVVALLPDDTLAADAWKAGARGVLLRHADAGRLVAALAAVVGGLAVFDPALAAGVPLNRPAPPAESLTPREREVLARLAEGLSNKGIAQQLDISEHTVKFHLNAILAKLGAQSRTEAVVQAIRLGLITV